MTGEVLEMKGAGPRWDTLNLVDHPELLGRSVYLKGDIVSPYFGTVGMKKSHRLAAVGVIINLDLYNNLITFAKMITMGSAWKKKR